MACCGDQFRKIEKYHQLSDDDQLELLQHMESCERCRSMFALMDVMFSSERVFARKRRWLRIKRKFEQISESAIPPCLQVMNVPVRNALEAGFRPVIFEINLTSCMQLSDKGLKGLDLDSDPDSGKTIWRLHGYRSGMENFQAFMLTTPSKIIREIADTKGALTTRLGIEIEQRLQRLLEKADISDPMIKKLSDHSVCLPGVFEKKNGAVSLVFSIPSEIMSIIVQRSNWLTIAAG